MDIPGHRRRYEPDASHFSGRTGPLRSMPHWAHGQDARMARGKITALAANELTIKVGDRDMTFGVDGATHVVAAGGGTKTRAAQEVGRPGPRLDQLLRVGQGVEVTYADSGSSLHASRIRSIA